MPVIPINRVVGKKKIIRKNWRSKEEERHKRSLTPRPPTPTPTPHPKIK
jgi:hypothetical protein